MKKIFSIITVSGMQFPFDGLTHEYNYHTMEGEKCIVFTQHSVKYDRVPDEDFPRQTVPDYRPVTEKDKTEEHWFILRNVAAFIVRDK